MANTAPLNPQVSWFARQMQVRLNENAHKGGWRHEDRAWLVGRMHEEMFELEQALFELRTNEYPDEELAAVIHETADVANFAMMIASNAKRDAEAKDG